MTSEPSPTQFLTPARLWLSPRIRFIGPFLVAGLLGWAGVLRLRPALGATAQLARRQADGAQRVQALERQLREIEPNPPAEAGNALLESLHADPAGVVPWLSEAEREARRRGWILRSEVGEVSVRTLSGRDLVRVPVRFHLTPESGP
ncbi:MAG: hypothetical protein J0L84_19740, partial [Verrucomicrobia bacterium]|nr:hypothetical protein [Verrucomicrobiota bacterium]